MTSASLALVGDCYGTRGASRYNQDSSGVGRWRRGSALPRHGDASGLALPAASRAPAAFRQLRFSVAACSPPGKRPVDVVFAVTSSWRLSPG
jgi:hypothetical protein